MATRRCRSRSGTPLRNSIVRVATSTPPPRARRSPAAPAAARASGPHPPLVQILQEFPLSPSRSRRSTHTRRRRRRRRAPPRSMVAVEVEEVEAQLPPAQPSPSVASSSLSAASSSSCRTSHRWRRGGGGAVPSGCSPTMMMPRMAMTAPSSKAAPWSAAQTSGGAPTELSRSRKPRPGQTLPSWHEEDAPTEVAVPDESRSPRPSSSRGRGRAAAPCCLRRRRRRRPAASRASRALLRRRRRANAARR